MRKKHPFRHALLATAGTVSGIVLLLTLKPTTDPSAARTEPAITSSATASAYSPSASPSPSKSPGKKRTPSPSPSPTSTQPPHTASAARTGNQQRPLHPEDHRGRTHHPHRHRVHGRDEVRPGPGTDHPHRQQDHRSDRSPVSRRDGAEQGHQLHGRPQAQPGDAAGAERGHRHGVRRHVHQRGLQTVPAERPGPGRGLTAPRRPRRYLQEVHPHNGAARLRGRERGWTALAGRTYTRLRPLTWGFDMDRVTGIELALLAWEAAII